ncbi:hypothetical protein PAXRUDRAFT_826268 [Paxillus rubicundulus Ve08.2h10]|uniref:Uncharacterized protein n=1 Tax=Paxillus rubicundulus Ve08.2h10 TaxID=930991 RepID=A0A0D0DS62_9AGAM|nr:hypothetical protein PAXRUDRAFT_826268 [Paxillus rubicundulus Ve08.2h10]
MNPIQPSSPPTTMPIRTDYSVIPELESLSDSDWLDIATTDRESDENDSICSSRGTDHERLSFRSRSRRSSLSCGSSRDGDVDAWEGLIEDSADEGMSDDVPAPPHVPLVSQDAISSNINSTEETSEELRIQEGLDQSMISTLSSSRSSSLQGSTVHTSSRDLRLSFPDPITSSREELLNTSYKDVGSSSDTTFLATDPDITVDLQRTENEEMLSASQVLPPKSQDLEAISILARVGPELKVFLYGVSSPFKWSLIDNLLQRVVHGAGLTTTTDLQSIEGSVRQLFVTGPSERDRSFPRIITVVDKTLQRQDATEDPASVHPAGIPSLAVVYMPSCPPRLPGHVLYLPILALPTCSIDLPEFKDVALGSAQGTWDMFNVPDHQLLRISGTGEPAVIDRQAIEKLEPLQAYRAFSRVWSGNRSAIKLAMANTHAWTIIAILSLVLGVVLRPAFFTATQPVTATSATLESNCTLSSIWQLLRPVATREYDAPLETPNTPVVVTSSSFKDFALSIFDAESTSLSLPRVNPTSFHRVAPSTLSEHVRLSKDLMLQPSLSVLAPDNRPKALSVIPETSPMVSHRFSTAPTGYYVSALVHTSLPNVVKEYAPVISAIVNQDVQDILDALDALVQAISRHAQAIVSQANALVQHSAAHLERSIQSLENIKDTLFTRNEHAQGRAKEMKEQGVKWLYDAREAFSTSARFSKGKACELAEELANRARRARGKAKEMAGEVPELLNEPEWLEAFGSRAWDMGAKEWKRWHKRVEENGKPSKLSKRQLKPAILF